MTGAPFDTVVVPDFAGKGKITFEARTLYLLASWMEFSKAGPEFPLHLACIGEPPQSVVKLAAKAGAIISVHQPAAKELGVWANKLRGFEAPMRTARILLLDVDTLVLNDITKLASLIPEDAISAAPSNSEIIPDAMWEEFHAHLGVPLPDQRMGAVNVTLSRHGDAIYPSLNSGVILAPRASRLLERWYAHLAELTKFRDRWNEHLKPRHLSVTDEPAFITAVESLRREGQRFIRLPDHYNGRWLQLYRRAPTLDDFVVFHMTSSFGTGVSLEEKLNPAGFGYERKLLRRYARRWLQDEEPHARDAVQRFVPAMLEVRKLRPLLQRLHDKYIVTS